MASKQKRRPTLSVPIPSNDAAIAHFQSPRTAVHKSVTTPASKTTNIRKPDEDWSNVDPDDLFVRFTVPEIRNIQVKLRADADAKQEELRLMVGERYRDLLQASTSIISIADSSRRVMGALSDMREAIVPDESGRKPRSSSIRGKDDAHLKALQSLSAHLKLLLDAPEHLWRLLEKKQHLPAAWLFLLARVVHRALVTEDPDESWEHEGIDVSSQFPLVQRQWDTVAQFRSQIAHRATQYLREHSIPSETACFTILTLHLLDSLPLPETLSTLLSQRSRTLNTLFTRNLELRSTSRPGSPILKSRQKTREIAGKLPSPPDATTHKPARLHQDVVKDVRVAILECLDVIGGTVCIARDIFQADGDRKSLVERSLEDIQSDTSPNSVLNTSSLLSTLPSSTHLLTLPQSILSYKPYIDLTSPSTHVDHAILDTRLSAWFDKAIQGFEGRVHAWFEGLETIREVWGVRRKVLERLEATRGLEKRERMKAQAVLDEGVKSRVSGVTTKALKDAENTVDGALKKAIRDVKDEIKETRLDASPSTFLFSPPPIPFASQLSTNTGLAMASFKSFKDALRQRADCRTPSLDGLLKNIETKAQELEEDLETMDDEDQASRELREQVMAAHYPAAQSSLNRIIENMEQLTSPENTDVEGDSEKSIVVTVFLGRISHSMVSSSFGQSLRCQDGALQGFQDALEALHGRSLARWRTHTVSRAREQYAQMITTLHDAHPVAANFTWPSQPTPHLINALLILTSSLQRLGLSRVELYAKGVASDVVRDFKTSIADDISKVDPIWRQEHTQLLWDLTFLRRLSHARSEGPEESNGTEDSLGTKVALLQSRLRSSTQDETFSKLSAHIDHTIDQYIPRSQILLAPLITRVSPSKKTHANGNSTEQAPSLRVKPTALLPFGTPAADQDFKPAIETVKPSARFGLLLVGSTVMR